MNSDSKSQKYRAQEGESSRPLSWITEDSNRPTYAARERDANAAPSAASATTQTGPGTDPTGIDSSGINQGGSSENTSAKSSPPTTDLLSSIEVFVHLNMEDIRLLSGLLQTYLPVLTEVPAADRLVHRLAAAEARLRSLVEKEADGG